MHAYQKTSKNHFHIHYAHSIVSIPTMTLVCMVSLFTNNIIGEVHLSLVHKVSQDGYGLEKWLYLGLVASNRFMSLLNLHFNPPMPHSILTRQLTCILSYAIQYPLIHIQGPLHIAKPSHCEHILGDVAGVSKKALKVSIVSEMCIPMHVDLGMGKDSNIIWRARKTKSKWMKSPSCDTTIVLLKRYIFL